MQITKTRKAIIELIEKYMDKTLSEGCLVEYDNGINLINGDEYIKTNDRQIKVLQRGINFYRDGEYYNITYCEDYNCNNKDERDYRITKIIGHYDITALLKYIAIEKQIRFTEWGDDKIYFYQDINDILIGKPIFEINSKPLHLYTEKEETNLLELLK